MIFSEYNIIQKVARQAFKIYEMERNIVLTVVMKDGNIHEYDKNDFSDYEWRKEAFIVINDKQWIAMFNWDCVKEVIYS